MTQRSKEVDLIKGIGITLMVAGHCGAPFTKFIYLFHMAIFFIASGYCYKSERTDDATGLFNYLVRKLKTLWVPYFVWITIFSLLFNFLLKINVYTSDPTFLDYVDGPYAQLYNPLPIGMALWNIARAAVLHGGTQITGAFWFIATLLEVCAVYGTFDFLIKKITKRPILVQTLIAVLFLMIGWYCKDDIILEGWNRIFSYYSLFHLGRLLREFNVSERHKSHVLRIAVIVVSFVLLLFANNIGAINLEANTWENPVFLLGVSVVGWQMLYDISFYICKIPLLEKFVTTLGQNTLPILIFHFLAFKLVTWAGVVALDLPHCLIAAFPVYFEEGLWWVAYWIVGTLVPLGIGIGWKKIRH